MARIRGLRDNSGYEIQLALQILFPVSMGGGGRVGVVRRI